MEASRIASAIIDAISQFSGVAAYGTIIGILFICGLGIPIPEDITLLAAGLLAASGKTTLVGSLLAGFFGVMLGDGLMFFLGRRYGKRVFTLPGFRRIFTPDRIVAAEARIRKNGPFICFVARFLPGLRSPVFTMAGALGVKPSTFLLLDGLAALISVPVWVYLGYWFGNNLDQALAQAQELQVYLFIAICSLVLSYIAWRLWKKRAEAARLRAPSVAPGVSKLESGD